MLDRLIQYVLKAGHEELPQLAIEEIALADVWQQSWANDSIRSSKCEGIPAAVEKWASCVQINYQRTEGRRHQWTLREAIDELLGGRIGQLGWDHVNLLTTVYTLAGRAHDPDAFKRPQSLIAPFAAELAELAKSIPVAPGLPVISSRLHVVTGADIAALPQREIKLFAGVPVQSRGPVLIHEKGHLKVLDVVPENCSVVVENGSVSVEGFVMGRVAASQNCEVRDNIAGMVVVRRGNVRCRGVMVRAFVVSKLGSVICRQAEAPDLLYAGSEIVVEGSITMGTLKAPHIKVHDAIYGGTFHVTRTLTASALRNTETRNLRIVMRQHLNCQDYHEEVSADGVRLLNKANRIQRQIASLRERIAQTHNEAEHSARCGIAYLVGGDSALGAAEKIQRAQYRLALVNRATSVLQSLIGIAEERLERLARFLGKPLPEDEEDTQAQSSQLNEAWADFDVLIAEGEPETDINEEMVELQSIKETILAPSADDMKISHALEHLRARMRFWQTGRDQIQMYIAQQEGGIQVLKSAGERVRDIQTAMPMVQFLRQLITLLRERGDAPNSAQMMRLQGGFLRMILRTINNRIERAENYRRDIERLRDEFHEAVDRLRKQFQLAVADDELQSDADPPRVTGIFDAGVTICPDVYLLESLESSPKSVVRTEASTDSPQTYTRQAGRIVLVS